MKIPRLCTNIESILLKITTANILLLAYPLYGFEVSHRIGTGTSFSKASLVNACSTLRGETFSSKCNPALFPYSTSEGVSFTMTGKSDGDSIENGREIIFDPITEPLLRRLFTEKNFNSFTFETDLSFKSTLFELTYSPYYLMADLFIFNPAFPEISVNLANREALKLTTGTEIYKGDWFNSSLGFNLFYYDHLYANTIFSLADLAITRAENLIQFSRYNGISGDVGLYFSNETTFFPDFSFQAKNIATKIKKNELRQESATYQEALFLFENYYTVGVGKKISTIYGAVDVGIEQPFHFNEKTNQSSLNYTAASLRYNLSLIAFSIAGSKYFQSFALEFNSKNFNVGVAYTKDSETLGRQKNREDAIYSGLEINL